MGGGGGGGTAEPGSYIYIYMYVSVESFEEASKTGTTKLEQSLGLGVFLYYLRNSVSSYRGPYASRLEVL